ncbi:MAG: HEAT repeat domain-containing protein [Chloroflexota bacterium]|nr:HEAT repeat domain-containing protein [Chloroflexota bacterium]
MTKRELDAQLARITDPDPLMRLDAARRLGQLDAPGPDGTAALITALNDREWSVRAAAAEGLGRLESDSALFSLCEQLEHPRTEVRRAAVNALDAIGDRQATAPLILRLERERHNETRRLIVRALGRLGDDRALGPLQRLRGDKHWAVRSEAVAASERIMTRQE